MVCTDNRALADAVRSLRDWGRDCHCRTGQDNACGHRFTQQFGSLPLGYDHKFVYSTMGYNLKMTDIQGAIGCAQMEKLPGFVATRRKNYKYLANRFEEEQLTSFFRYVKAQPHTNPSPFGFPLIIEDPKIQKQALMQYLDKAGIATRPVFAGNILRQPYIHELLKKEAKYFTYCSHDSFPNADMVMNAAFWIGCYPGLTQEQLEFMVQTFKAFCMGLK